ncbi:MAG: TlpA disulfide reductase family protein [Solirubrobacterales bacterium]
MPEQAQSHQRHTSLLSYLPRIIAVTAILALLTLLVFGVIKKAPTDRIDSRLERGESTLAPDFRLKVISGAESRLMPAKARRALADGWLSTNELRGNPVVLNFWASWCQPCRDEAPYLEKAATAASRKGVIFVGVNVLDITKNGLDFIDEFGVRYPNVRDPSLATARKYEARAMPETFFISRQGTIVNHVIGIVNPQQMVRGLLAAESGRAVPVASGGAQRSTEKK